MPMAASALIWLVLGVSGLVASAPAGAQPSSPPAGSIGVRLLPGPTSRPDPRSSLYIVDHLAPGTTVTREVEVANDSDETQLIDLYPAAARLGEGIIHFADGRTANELTSWTTVDPGQVELAPRSTATTTVTVAVPSDASPGERYGVVWAEVSSAPRPGAVTTVNRVGVRMYLSVGEGGEPASDFEMTTLEARRDAEGRPLVEVNVANTGERALDLSGELELTDGPGGLSAGPFSTESRTTLGVGETGIVTVLLDKAVTGGPWNARITLRSGWVEHEATAKLTFPPEASASTGSVEPEESSSSGWVVPVVALAIVGALAVGGGAYFLGRRGTP